MNTMYVDKPMRGHGLMQAIARVNRVFRDKPGGLIVDYIGIAQNLKKALSDSLPPPASFRTMVNTALPQRWPDPDKTIKKARFSTLCRSRPLM